MNINMTNTRLFTFWMACSLLLSTIPSLALAQTTDPTPMVVDDDGDGLIEIHNIDQLNSIRYNLRGTSYKATSASATGITAGCPSNVCVGYELVSDLDFDATSSYASGTVNTAYTTGTGWTEIGTFESTFDGNGFTISNLFISRTGSSTTGLFGYVSNSTIQNVGLIDPDVSSEGGTGAGPLAGNVSNTTVQNCYSSGGSVITSDEANSDGSCFGGLVGRALSSSVIRNCFAATEVRTHHVHGGTGGVVGALLHSKVINCYATGSTRRSSLRNSFNAGQIVGRIVGNKREGGEVINCYATDINPGVSAAPGVGTQMKLFLGTEAELKALTAAMTGWSENDWDFGDNTQYPTLRSYEEQEGIRAGKGFIICGQPTERVTCNSTTPEVTLSPALDFGEQFTETTRKALVVGRNLTTNITLALSGPQFALATGQSPTLSPVNGLIRELVEITFTPTTTGGVFDETLTLTSTDLTGPLTADLTVDSAPGAFDEDGDNLFDIKYIEQLYLIRITLDRDYELVNNLDFADPDSYATGAVDLTYLPVNQANPNTAGAAIVADPADGLNPGWLPIGENFEGTFDGKGFEIRNLYINNTTLSLRVGLFGEVSGTVRNLGVTNAYISAQADDAGVLAGRLTGEATIHNCYTSGLIENTEATGGLIGIFFSANTTSGIRNCYADIDILGTGTNSTCGGLIGASDTEESGRTLSIFNSYTTGEIQTTNFAQIVGGLIGEIKVPKATMIPAPTPTETTSISKSYSTIRTRENWAFSKGLVGQSNGSTLNITSSFLSTARLSFGKTTAELLALTTANSAVATEDQWSELDWDFGTNNQYPTLRSYKLNEETVPAQIQGDILPSQPGNRANSAPSLDADDDNLIDINSIEDLNRIRYNLSGNYELTRDLDFDEDNSYVESINPNYLPNNETISLATNAGFTPIGTTTAPFTGKLEGNGFTIYNLYIQAPTTLGEVGLFGATAVSDTIQNIQLVDAYVRGNGANAIGTLIGSSLGVVQNASATGDLILVNANQSNAGGLLGLSNSLNNAYADVTVTASGPESSVGGLVGSVASAGQLTNAYAIGEVVAGGDATVIGGLVGNNEGTVTNTYATGATSLNTTNSNNTLNPLVATGTATASFWLADATDDATGARTQADLQALTAGAEEATNNPNGTGWNAFDWNFGNNSQYPALRAYQENDADPAVQIEGDILPNQPGNRGAPLSLDIDGNGLIEITSIEDLNNIRYDLSAGYELIDNLNFADPDSYASGVVNTAYVPDNEDITMATNAGFTPIGGGGNQFTGFFEGNDFTISNLYINSTANFAGLFGSIGTGGEVQNLGLLGVYVKAESTGEISIGGLAGEISGGASIRNCYVTGEVIGESGGIVYAGGLVGETSNTTTLIRNCYATAAVAGERTNGGNVFVGGLVGGIDSSVIRNCYATGAVSGINISSTLGVGGLVGSNGGEIINCYATGEVSGTSAGTLRQGGLAGSSSDGYVENSYWDKTTTGQTTSKDSPDASGLTTAELQALTATGTTWSTNNWVFSTNSRYPALRAYTVNKNDRQIAGELLCGQAGYFCADNDLGEGFIAINTIQDLNNIRYNLDADYVLTRDLDFADADSYAGGVLNTDYIPDNDDIAMATNAGFAPIGDGTNSFTGTFEGNDFTISNLYINITTSSLLYAGLFGHVSGSNGRVQNLGLLDVYVKVEGTSDGEIAVGGLTGINRGETIRNCYVTGEITVTGNGNVRAGGLVGGSTGSPIRNCYATATVTGEETGDGNIFVGGLIGRNVFSGNGNISNCYATGAVTATSTGTGDVNTGGLVGANSGRVSNCYATGAVTGTMGTGGTLDQGGLVGNNAGGTPTNNYFNSTTSSQTVGIGGSGASQTGVTSATTAELQALTAPSGWSHKDWNFGTNSQYPALRAYELNTADTPTQIVGDLLPNQPSDRALGLTTDGDGDGLIDITTIEDLNNIRMNLIGNYELLNDLDFTADASYASGTANINYRPQKPDGTLATTDQEIADATNQGWNPIGYLRSLEDNTKFRGSFNGNGFTISNLFVNETDGVVAGLFGALSDAVIQNLRLENAYVNNGITSVPNSSPGSKFAISAGALCGTNYGIVRNVSASGDVKIEDGIGAGSAGGLVGVNFDVIENSYANVDVSTGSFGSDVGGLVGSCTSTSSIRNAYATGTVTATVDVNLMDDLSLEGTVIAGGLVGILRGFVTNAYATGVVTGTETRASVRGLNGLVTTGGINSYTGGLIGLIPFSGNAIVTNGYFSTSTSQAKAIGTLVGITGLSLQQGITPSTDTQLQALTASSSRFETMSWDFGTNEQFPALRNYLLNTEGIQIIGTTFPDQLAPRPGGDPAISIDATLSAGVTESPTNTFNFGTVSTDADVSATFTYTILGSNLADADL